MGVEAIHDLAFLPGISVDHMLKRLAKAGGNEVASGKFASPESSAALAVNTFGWFIEPSQPACGCVWTIQLDRRIAQTAVFSHAALSRSKYQ
jgi:hypothetical protein